MMDDDDARPISKAVIAHTLFISLSFSHTSHFHCFSFSSLQIPHLILSFSLSLSLSLSLSVCVFSHHITSHSTVYFLSLSSFCQTALPDPPLSTLFRYIPITSSSFPSQLLLLRSKRFYLQFPRSNRIHCYSFPAAAAAATAYRSFEFAFHHPS